jgi:hypothetical protein
MKIHGKQTFYLVFAQMLLPNNTFSKGRLFSINTLSMKNR